MEIKRNLYLNGIFIACSTAAGGTLAGLNTLNIGTGAAVGFVSSLVVVGGLALYDGRSTMPQSGRQKNQRARAFEYQRPNHTQQTVSVRDWKDLLGLRRQKTSLHPVTRPVELDDFLFGSYTRTLRPFIFTEHQLWKLFRGVAQHTNRDRNLSRRYHVERTRSVNADLYDAIWNLLTFTQFKTGVQIVRETKFQWYALNEQPNRVFNLMRWVELSERRQGRGAPAMNTALYQRHRLN